MASSCAMGTSRRWPVRSGCRGRLDSAGLMTLPIVNRLDHKQGCCTAADAEDARRVADRLAIPFYALNLDQEFGRIIDYFVDEYTVGRTPIPACSATIGSSSASCLTMPTASAPSSSPPATTRGSSHQRATQSDGSPALLRGSDAGKDQSYVLFGIQREISLADVAACR